MAYTPLRTDFKDDILDSSNYKRKYKQVVNNDGTFSFQDETTYQQVGSDYGAKEVNEERAAINNVYENKLVALDDVALVTEEGFFVDALAVKELNSNLANIKADLIKANNSLNVIGTEYWSGVKNNYSYSKKETWVNNVSTVTIPAGTYIFTLKATPCAKGQSYDVFVMGITGINSTRTQNTFYMNFGNGFYPILTSTCIEKVPAGTYGIAFWSSQPRNVNGIELRAIRIK